jgi:hypothetical protein
VGSTSRHLSTQVWQLLDQDSHTGAQAGSERIWSGRSLCPPIQHCDIPISLSHSPALFCVCQGLGLVAMVSSWRRSLQIAATLGALALGSAAPTPACDDLVPQYCMLPFPSGK